MEEYIEYEVYNDYGHGYAEFSGTYEECVDYKGIREDLMIMKSRS